MRGLLEMHQIPVGKNLSLESITPNRKSEKQSSNTELWLNNTDSLLSRRLPGLDILRNIFYHRLLILILLGSLITLFWNTLFGLATQSGSREYTIDLTERISGSSSYYHPAAHFDPVSIILIVFILILLYSTRPFYDKEE
jgi:Na+/H+ antiporter NhaC